MNTTVNSLRFRDDVQRRAHDCAPANALLVADAQDPIGARILAGVRSNYAAPDERVVMLEVSRVTLAAALAASGAGPLSLGRQLTDLCPEIAPIVIAAEGIVEIMHRSLPPTVDESRKLAALLGLPFDEALHNRLSKPWPSPHSN